MKNHLSKFFGVLLLASGMVACKKETENKPTGEAPFQSITFRFGADSTAVLVDNKSMVVKNMPRSADVTQLGAKAVLPAGYSISPDPATAKDYTKGVTYTVTTNDGKKYTVQITAPAYDAVNNPYGIYTAVQLNDIRKGLNDSYVLMNDITLPDLTASGAAATTGISDYRDYGWYSIGARYVNGGNVTFRGTLDGQNHMIKNVTILYRGNNQPTGIDVNNNGKGSEGLFGYAVKANLKNLGIQLANTGINAVAIDGSGYGNVGALVGQADSCAIANCFVTGNTISGQQFTGGLIGKLSNSTVSKCYATFPSTAGSYAIATNEGGGLIGNAYNSTITDCSASGSVIGAGSVGGLIGSINTCTIKTSFASGNVGEYALNGSSSLIAANSLGGLIGTVSSVAPATTVIQNCYATGAVSGNNGSNTDFHKSTRIGGLIGQITNTSGPVQVTNSYASGQVSRVWIAATAPFFTGGLCGNTPNNVFTTAGQCSNYWDKTTTGQTVLGGGNGVLAQDNAITANGKTTAEMKTAAIYNGWDFSATWNVAAGTNNGYPYLRTVAK